MNLETTPPDIAPLPGLPRDEGGPAFKAPWEAQAFALTLALHERGAFTWKEWAATLAAIIGEAQAHGQPDLGDDYYRHWLTALERIAIRKALVGADELVRQRDAWEAAARATPHGQPIRLPDG
jgi:nitrile hydratase accessory protein